jgi:hypothetical protein
MKWIINLLTACVVLLALFSQPIGVAAAEVSHFTGRSVDANFTSIDSSGCISSSVNLFAGDLLSDTPPGQAAPGIIVGIFLYDRCTNTQLLTASTIAPLSKKDFRIAGNLNSATLDTTLSVFDEVSGTFVDVTVNLTWIGTSPVERQHNHFNYRFEDCLTVLHNNTAFRYAEASGTVTIGSTNFTPEPSIEGHIGKTTLGNITQGCQ